MRSEPFPEPGPKRKLIETAERLIAERGFEAVSVRDITQAAKTNVAAVNYHFGSRAALVELVMIRAVEPLVSGRLDALAAAEAGGAAAAGDIVEAWLQPLVQPTKKRGNGAQLHFRLLGLVLAQQGSQIPAAVAGRLERVGERFRAALAAALPAVAADELASRLDFVSGSATRLLIQQDGTAPPLDEEMARLVRFATAGMLAGTETAREIAADPPPEPDASETAQAMFDF